MIRIKDAVFSLDVLEKKFKCNLPDCHGNCCRYGDSGAPLAEDEKEVLDDIWERVRPFLRPEGIRAIEEQGTSVIDTDHELVTPLINNRECAYTVFSGDIFMCGIEKAWGEGIIKFRKPLSCHLFPVRIKHFTGFRTVNYEGLQLCSAALGKGTDENVYVYEFLKQSLIRALGRDIYDELSHTAAQLRKEGKIK